MDDKAAKTLRALQKLPANKRCFNCDALGPSYVVPQFSIFVCTDCSGIHMHTGHRVKSIAMAKFTPEEVKKLQEGGNETAGRSYLARWKPETDTQKPVDRNAKRVQQWIKIIFTDKAYYSEVSKAPAPVEIEPLKLEEPPKLVAPISAAPPLNRTSPPAPATPPAKQETSQNLLDFGPDPEPAPKPAAAASSTAADPFDPFAAPAAPAAPAAANSSAATMFDPFGNTQGGSPSTTAATFDPFSTAAATPAPGSAPAFEPSFDPFNNGPAAPWSSPAPKPAAPAPSAAPSWTTFDSAPAFPPPTAQPFGAAPMAFPNTTAQPPALAPGSVSSSASATPTASAAAVAFGQNAFGTGGFTSIITAPAGQPAGLTSPLHSASVEAAFATGAFPTSSSSAPVTPTSGAMTTRGELPPDIFGDPAFPAAVPFGGMGPMGFGGMAQPGFPGAPFGHAMPPHQPGFMPHGMPGYNPGQVMPGMHFPAPGMGGYTRQNTGPATFGGGPPAPAGFQGPASAGFQGPAPGMGMDTSFFPQQAPFPGQQQAPAFGAPNAYTGMPAPYAPSATGGPAQPSYGMPAPTPVAPAVAAAPAKKEEDSFADLLGGLNLKSQPKSGPSAPSAGGFSGLAAAPAASGNPFA